MGLKMREEENTGLKNGTRSGERVVLMRLACMNVYSVRPSEVNPILKRRLSEGA
jgi:hypothetical protein